MLLKNAKTQFIASILGAAALLAGSNAGATEATYDPIEAVIALAIVNSGNLSPLDVAVMRDVSFKGLYSTGGFIDYLKTVRGVSDKQLNALRSNIVTQLGHASLGHGSFMTVSTASTGQAMQSYMSGGRAFSTLISASNGVFHQAYVMEALNAMHAAMNSSRPPELAASVK